MQQQEDGSIGGPGFAIKNTDAVDRGLAVVGDHRRCLDGRLCTGGCGRRYGRKKREVRWQGRPTAPDRGSQVRSRLAAGGRWIRTIGTASESCSDFGKSVISWRYLQARTPPPDADEAVCDHCGLRVRRASASSARRASPEKLAGSRLFEGEAAVPWVWCRERDQRGCAPTDQPGPPGDCAGFSGRKEQEPRPFSSWDQRARREGRAGGRATHSCEG